MMVYAGSVIEEGQCLIRVTQQEGSSRYDKIVEMIEQTEKLKSEAEHKAANLADRLVPYTLLGSAATWLLSGNALRAQSVLMVDFSCALKPGHAAGGTVCHARSSAAPHNGEGR